MIERKKRSFFGIFLASVFSLFAFSSSASALQLTELEPKIDTSAKVELNEPESPYDFDVTLLDKNQTVEYDATITNDSAYDIEITSVEINNSDYAFLNYTFDGLANSDVINASESKTIRLFVNTNDASTSTVAEDLNLQIHYKELEESTPTSEEDQENPNTYTGKAILSVVAVATGAALIVIFKKSSRIRVGLLLFIIPALGLILLADNTNAESDLIFNILGKVRFINSYSVTIDPNGGIYEDSTAAKTEIVRDGTAIRLSEPSRDTYTFAGWDADAGEIINDTITITGNTIITAQWDEIYHTVSVDPNGGSYDNKTDISEISVREGDTFHIGDDPIRDTYTFQGWNIIPNELDPNADIVITQDISFKALWDENYFNVTIDPNGGEYLSHTTSYTNLYREGDEITMSTPTRDTYRFTGWNMSVGELDENNKFSVSGDVTLTAQWEEIYYTVTINPNGGTYNNHTEAFSTDYREGYKLTLGEPSRDTYTFAGWTADPAILGQDNTLIVTSNVEITANWDEIYYTLTIDPNGGAYGEHTEVFSTDYRAGQTISIDTPTRDTYSFSGWSVQGSPVESGAITLNGNTTITAQWGEIMHTLTINPNGGIYGEHTEEFSTEYHEGTTISILTPSRDTYDFDGWTTNGDSITNNEITLTQDTTLTANWEEIYYTLTINPNGGTYGEHTRTFTEEYRAESEVSLLTPTKTGCDFANWTLEDDSEFTGETIKITRDITLVANYNDQYFDVTVNPNGGKFNNSTEVWTDRVKYGTTLDLTSAEYAGHEIRDWTKNDSETLAADTTEIVITSDVNLVINWWSTTFYTITINPNEGIYNESSEIQTFSIREGETFTLEEPSREGYVLSQWTFEDGSALGNNSFVVDNDHTLTANWFVAVAQNTRTHTYYPTIMDAHNEAEDGDTILVLTDTAEIVTNEKQIILDLGTHTITGFILNTASGDLTLINGEINNYASPVTDESNPSHAAVINNGTLSVGINDYTSDGTVNILRDDIRLIGSEIGLIQNSVFNFYDGYIEGDVGLDGGYNDSPVYRNISDSTTLYYFPFVTHNDLKDCQHVELQNADRAVSKTTEHGDVYYYNLQDNINTSAKTGYKIYAVRSFDASYPITVSEQANITFDLYGNIVTTGNDWTIDGTLNIVDSKTGEEAGLLRTSRTITNNGNLNLTNAKATSLSSYSIVNNKKNISLTNSTLSSALGYSLEISAADTQLNMDETSYIRAEANSIIAVYNTSSNFVIDGGNIVGITNAVKNADKAKMTIKSGNFLTEHTISGSINLSTVANEGTLIIEGGNFTSLATGDSRASAAALDGRYSDGITILGGEFYCNSANAGSTCLTNIYYGTTEIYDATVSAIAKNSAIALGTSSNKNKIFGGTFSATSHNSTAIAVSNSSKITISGGTFTSTAESKNTSTAVRNTSTNSYSVIDGDATLRAYSNGGSGIGIFCYVSGCITTAGDIYGDTYGLYLDGTSVTSTIGINDSDEDDGSSIITEKPIIKGGKYGVYNGIVSFYDGVIYGDVYSTSSDILRTIPHDAEIKTAVIDGTEKTWLEHTDDYLEVDGLPYNSFTKAYNAAKESPSETKTIIVTDNHTSASTMPTIERGQSITLNLNGFTIQNAQSLRNEGELTIVDNNSNSGVFENINAQNTPAIETYGTFTQNGGTIKGRYTAIKANYTYSYGGYNLNLNAGQAIIENLTDSSTLTAVSCNSDNRIVTTISSDYVISANARYARGIESCGNVALNGGTITATSITTLSNSSAYATYGVAMTVNSGTITATASSDAYALDGRNSVVKGGTITATSTNGVAVGYNAGAGKIDVRSGTITAHSDTKQAYGVRVNTTGYNSERGSAEITGGTITATSDSSTATGAQITNAVITGGTIFGTTYGVNGVNDSNPITIGVDDGTIINGANATPSIESNGEYVINSGNVSYYDGVLKGENPYTEGAVKAVPDGATFHCEVISSVNHCWLKLADPYLHVVGGGNYYSLSEAYRDTPDGGTINVIDDYTTQAELPTNPAGKTITINLNDHHLSYYQSLANEGTIIIVDDGDDPDKVGILENINPVSTPTIQNGSSSSSNAKLEIRGGIVTSSYQTISNYGTVDFYDGELSCTSITSDNGYVVYNQGDYSHFNIPSDAGNPIIRATKTTTNYNITAIFNGTVEINKGTIEVEGNGSGYGIDDAIVTLNNGTINVSTNGSAYGIQDGSRTITINDGTINVSSENYSAYGVDISSGKVIMKAGAITATSKNAAYGISTSRSGTSNGTVEISGGSISAVSNNNTGTGIAAGGGFITDGTVYGSTYGVSTANNYVIAIGDNTDDSLSTTTPVIIGDSYALYGGSMSFYDGIIKGGIGANTGEQAGNNIKRIADNTAIHINYETIDGDEYEVKYLVGAHPVAIINETDDYLSLYDAVEASVPGDVIRLKEDNYVYHNIVVDPDQEVTIDLDGHTIVTGNPITNNGKLTLVNNYQTTPSAITYKENNDFIRNTQKTNSNVQPELTLENVEIHAAQVISASSNSTTHIKDSKLYGDYGTYSNKYALSGYNNRNLIIKITDGSYLFSKNTALSTSNSTVEIKDSTLEVPNEINSSAAASFSGTTNYTIDNSEIKGNYYKSIDASSGSTIGLIKNHSKIHGILAVYGDLSILDSTVSQTSRYNNYSLIALYTTDKNLVITNSTITRKQNASSAICSDSNSLYGNSRSLIESKGILTATNITMHHSYADSNACNMSYIKNTGTANIDGLTIDNDDSEANSTARTSVGIVNAGQMELTNADININRATSYGIYTTDGELNMTDTTISVSGNTVYGAYVSNGDLVMGIPEPSDSPNYGTGDADVSITNPSITAIGTTSGIGVYKDLGRFKYFDGVITGSTAAIPRDKISTDVEHLYEPTFHTDLNGYDVCILTWMYELQP